MLRSFVDADGVEYQVKELSVAEVMEFEKIVGKSIGRVFIGKDGASMAGITDLAQLLYLALVDNKGKTLTEFGKGIRMGKGAEMGKLIGELVTEFAPAGEVTSSDPTGTENSSTNSPQSREEMQANIASEK